MFNSKISLFAFIVVAGILIFIWFSKEGPLYFGVAVDGYPVTQEKLAQTEREINWKPQIVVFYMQWPAPHQEFQFPKESFDLIWRSGAVPCLTWEPMRIEQGKEQTILFNEILNGHYDSYLEDFAKQSVEWKHPYLMRFAHEMNLRRYHWGTEEKDYGAESPELYVKTFRYIVDKFRQQKADQVLWVFNPNVESIPNPNQEKGAEWNTIAAYYPGDSYVDVFGLDGYNWGRTKEEEWNSSWKTFPDIFYGAFKALKKTSWQKPILIFETASVQGDRPQDQQKWLEEALYTCKKWGIEGFVWFQVNKEQDWRLSSQPQRFEDQFTVQPSAQVWVEKLIHQRP